MPNRKLPLAAAAVLLLVCGCRDKDSGPIEVSAIGGPPRMANPNRDLLDPPSAFLLESTAEGLVRFDSAGNIEPGLAQSWIISNDGLRYTFRLARERWRDGSRITAEQVVARLKAAAAPGSRNPLRPLLGAIDEVEAMTDEVLEISLKSPRPNFLQLLAQPQMAVLRNGEGIGPLAARARPDGSILLEPPPAGEDEEEEEDGSRRPPPLVLRGEPADLAVARFGGAEADLVLGGTIADLPVARAARVRTASLVFDPAAGLLGLSVASSEGRLARADVRHALAMAIDRPALVAALGVPGLQPRETLLPPGIEGLSAPAAPDWVVAPLAERRAAAARTLAPRPGEERLRIRVSLPEGPGWRVVFGHLRRDWAAVGVEAVRVGPKAAAELRLIDEVAPVQLASWYLRRFACTAAAVCDPTADQAMDSARSAADQASRRSHLAAADRLLAATGTYIPLAAPVRWSLVSPRLNAFRPNPFARHPAGELVRPSP